MVKMVKDEKELINRITQDPGVMSGKPVIRGTRLTVQFIIGLLAEGFSVDEIIEEYEGISEMDVKACLLYASKSMDHTYVKLLKAEAPA